MKFFLSILMMTAVCVGLFARMAPASGACKAVVENCHGHEDEACPPNDDHEHHHPCSDENACPVEGHHHHHGSCFHGLQMAAEEMLSCQLIPPAGVNLGRETLSLVPPDGPVHDLDKPPII